MGGLILWSGRGVKRRESEQNRTGGRQQQVGNYGVRSMSKVLQAEASLADWLAGQCGVVDFAWMTGNQGFEIS